jgi:hypothetical protein
MTNHKERSRSLLFVIRYLSFHRLGVGTLACMVLALTTTDASQDWVPSGDEDGVALAFRDVPSLDAREVRAIAEIPHAAERILSVVCDFTQALDPDVRDAKILSGDVSTRYSIYLRYAPRYLVVAPRDVVIDVRRESNGCTWSEIAGPNERRSGTVRMPLLRGAWVVEALEPSRARVTYQIAVKPGGSIPGWLVRRGAASALPRVIEQVTRCLSTTPAGGRCSAKSARD